MSEPIIRYAEMPEGREFDEFIARDVKSVHVEAMGSVSWWIGVELHDGRMWHINLGAVNDRAKAFAVCEEV